MTSPGRPDHDRDHPQRVRLVRAGHERDADPQLVHADHLRGQGLLGRDPRRARRRARPVARPAALPRQPRDLREARRRDVRLGGLPAGRRLLHERLVHDGHAPERRDDLRPDLLARPARRLLGHARALARRRRQGPGRADGLARDLPGGHALGADAHLRRGRAARGHHRPAPPQRPLRLLARRRHERAGRRLPHRRGAVPGDPRPLRLRDLSRGPRRDLPPVGGARARGRGGDPGRHLPGRGLPRRRRARPRPDSRSSSGSTSRATR